MKTKEYLFFVILNGNTYYRLTALKFFDVSLLPYCVKSQAQTLLYFIEGFFDSTIQSNAFSE